MKVSHARVGEQPHSVAYSPAEILDAVHSYMFGSEHPDVVGYRNQSLERDLANGQRFVSEMENLCRLGDFHKKRILDVGCGLGWQALAVSMIGDNSVVASDILQSMIDGATECVNSLRARGLKFDVTPLRGDICGIDLEDESFDGIYSLEAIEHVHDLDRMFDSCARLLRRKGRMIVANDANVLNGNVKREIEAMWNQRERSWEWSNYLRSIRPVEHGEARPFELMRREIVQAANPTLDEASVQSIVDATPGMLKPEIEEIAVSFSTGSSLPIRRKLDWCRDPVTGEYAERLFDPFDLADMIRKRGFSVKIRHGFNRKPLNLLNGIQFKPMNIALFNLRPIFVLVAEKL
jgi:ubiquinone/menaquinone biosynthesis C-methylase UbiE